MGGSIRSRFSGLPIFASNFESSYENAMRSFPSPRFWKGGNIRMQARLYWSHDVFSLEKNPTTRLLIGELAEAEGIVSTRI